MVGFLHLQRMDGKKNEDMKKYRKLLIQCILFSILGMIVLIFSKYALPKGNMAVPDPLFWSMLAAAGVVLILGIVGYVVTSGNLKRK